MSGWWTIVGGRIGWRRGIAVAASLACAGVATGAASAPSDREKPRKADPDALRVMHDFGRCVGHSRSSAQLLAVLPYSPEEQRIVVRIATSECLTNGMLKFRAPVLRGVVAEQLYLANFTGGRPRKAVTPVFADLSPADLAAADPAQRTAVQLILFGQCVSSVDPADVAALLATPAMSMRERTAFGALQPALGRCIESGTFHLNRFALRGFLAEGAYRNAVEEVSKPHA